MKPKTLVVLAVLVGALAAFIAFYERDLPGSDERKTLSERVLPKLAAADIVGFDIDWNGKQVRLERAAAPEKKAQPDAAGLATPREWKLVAPLAARADRTMADRLASDLAGLHMERKLDGAARKDVGLVPPRGKVSWKTSDGGSGTLEIGGDVPASSNIVVDVAGGATPLVIAKALLTDIDRAPGDWRAKEVLDVGRDKIDRIRIVPAGGGEEVVLARKGEKFSVERPYADAADPEQVDPLLSELTSLKVDKFLDAPLAPDAEKGLAAGAGRIELSLAGRTAPFVVELGAETQQGGDRYLRADGQSMEAKTKLAEAITRPVADWRSKAWTSFDSWKVERIRVSDAEGKLELARSSGDWLRDGKKIPYTDVGDLLYAITSARADQVLSGAAAQATPAGSPRLTIIFSDANGGEETLTLGNTTGDHVPARVSGRDVVLMLPAKTATDVEAKVAAVRLAKPAEEAAAKEKKAEKGAAPKKI